MPAPSTRPRLDSFDLIQACSLACQSQDPEALLAALAMGDPISALSEDYAQILLPMAVSGGCARCAQILIDAGAPVSGRGAYGGELPLGSAARDGNASMCALLIKAGADLSAGMSPTRAGEQCPPLCMAAKAGRHEALSALLNAGAPVDSLDEASQSSALLWAVEAGGPLESIALLLERGADPALPNAQGHTPMFLAAFRQESAMVELIEAALLKRALNSTLPAGRPRSPASGL